METLIFQDFTLAGVWVRRQIPALQYVCVYIYIVCIYMYICVFLIFHKGVWVAQ